MNASTIEAVARWLEQPALAWGLGCFSVAALLASVLLVPRLLATLPPGYLRDGVEPRQDSFVRKLVRNALGLVLIVLGLAMLVLPGQGLLTLLVGLLLVDLPGKHAVLVRFLSRPKVLAVVNRLRSQRGAPPLTT